jgi:multiple sugar transport system ATP-binding protein
MLERRPKALSGGQRQRVALGRAIVRKPKVFLFDEPLSNLDAKMRVQMRAEISKLHRRLATTMIYVTHDQVEAMTMGDRICMMKDGRIQQVAQPLEIYNRPANMFVAAFIGSPPMNFFEGTLAQEKQLLFFCERKTGDGPGGLRLRVDERQASRLAGWINKPIYLGLRPEDIDDRNSVGEAPAGRVFRAAVDLVESMGPETLFHLKTETHRFTVRSQGQVREQATRTIDLVAHMEKAHFFEAIDPGPYKKESGSVDLEAWQAACRCIV